MDYRDRWELKEYLLEQRLSQRVTLFHLGVVVVLLAYLLAFWYLQVVQGEAYAEKAELKRQACHVTDVAESQAVIGEHGCHVRNMVAVFPLGLQFIQY